MRTIIFCKSSKSDGEVNNVDAKPCDEENNDCKFPCDDDEVDPCDDEKYSRGML